MLVKQLKDNLAATAKLLALLLWPLAALAEPPTTMPAARLIQALQAGVHVIYIRHGATNHDQKDTNRVDLNNCDGQRNLSPAGIEELQAIAGRWAQLDIPVANVYSSPYCRCRHTAEQLFGRYQLEPDLQFSISKDAAESQRLGERLKALMLAANTTNGNAVFVGHTSNLRDGLGVWPKPEGVAVVFEKDDSRMVYKGMIKPHEWAALD